MVTNPNVSSDTFVITKNKASRDMMRKVIIVAGLILFMVIGRSHGQEKKFYDAPLVGVKTNALYWLTTTINVGAGAKHDGGFSRHLQSLVFWS